MGGRGGAGGTNAGRYGGVTSKGRPIPKASRGEVLEVVKAPVISVASKHRLLTTHYGLTADEATAALKEFGLL